jgi:hypothetical protein
MYSGSPEHLICAIHPYGPPSISCPDFAALASAQVEKGEWEVTVLSYYAGQLVPGFGRVVTVEEQWELVDWHPLFTGVCPECGAVFDQTNLPEVHWDCLGCGWKDDTV